MERAILEANFDSIKDIKRRRSYCESSGVFPRMPHKFNHGESDGQATEECNQSDA